MANQAIYSMSRPPGNSIMRGTPGGNMLTDLFIENMIEQEIDRLASRSRVRDFQGNDCKRCSIGEFYGPRWNFLTN